MAYSVPFQTTCYVESCRRPAKEKVYNRWNDEMGQYCREHAKQRVAELDAAEKRNDGRVHSRGGDRG